MNLNEKFPVSPSKVEELKKRIDKLGIQINKIEEQFTRGGGHGGQKINKTSNCVILKYPPLNLHIRMQRDRQRSLNRFLALRELVDQVEMKLSPHTSKRLKEIEKIRKQKKRRHRKTKTKERYSMNPTTTQESTQRIAIEKPTEEKMLSLGIPPTPVSKGKWSTWECSPNTFDWEYPDQEIAYVYTGKVRVKTAIEEVEIEAGDLVIFPKGLKCTWTVLETIRKVYTFQN